MWRCRIQVLTEISRSELFGQRHGGLAKRIWGGRQGLKIKDGGFTGWSEVSEGPAKCTRGCLSRAVKESKQTKRAATINFEQSEWKMWGYDDHLRSVLKCSNVAFDKITPISFSKRSQIIPPPYIITRQTPMVEVPIFVPIFPLFRYITDDWLSIFGIYERTR